MTTKALFLDRDGVINVDRAYVYRKEDFHFMDGIFDLCHAAKEKGYLIIIVTNQSGIERGYYTELDYLTLTQYMLDEFARNAITIDDIYYCPHLQHEDRKPSPGMILKAQKKHHIDLKASLMIGDKPRDLEAGQRAGIPVNLLIGDHPSPNIVPTARIQNLHQALAWL